MPPLPARLVGVSTKMYFDLPTTQKYISELSNRVRIDSNSSCGVFVIPDFPSLGAAAGALQKTWSILLGAQDCHWEDLGPYTGEVSPLVLKQMGCSIVELGHAERRGAPFNETDEMIAKKAVAAVRNGLIPLVCIGEKSKSEIMSEGVGMAVRECSPQIAAVLNAVPKDADVVFAYEPIWAIGAKEPAGADHVNTAVSNLRKAIMDMGRSGQTRILYGGSAGPGTWDALKGEVDGLFIGRFGHNIEAFCRVITEVEKS
ncbi:hypothetical protein MMC09_006660 [Bachmanniomyces sp. S44760]|nr:hypothetical protein [Bachmanniomyces sp. S44760]